VKCHFSVEKVKGQGHRASKTLFLKAKKGVLVLFFMQLFSKIAQSEARQTKLKAK